MNKDKLKLLESAIKDIDDKFAHNEKILDDAAKIVEQIDLRISRKEKELEALEVLKQEALLKMRDVMESIPVNSYTRKNGYKIYFYGTEPLVISNIKDFMQWLKANYSPNEVLNFFAESIKLKNLQSFINEHLAKERERGILNSTIAGIELDKAGYRRLKTNIDRKNK